MLPQYIRLGTPTSLNRRTVRSKEKILILLLFVTLAFICFGGVFYLPDNFGASDKVIQAYKRLQNAGPEIFIPAPPVAESFHGHGHEAELPDRNERESGLHANDRSRLQAKINDDAASADHLEKPQNNRPEPNAQAAPETSSNQQQPLNQSDVDNVGNAPELQATIPSGDDVDSVTRERRNKVREVRIVDDTFSSTQWYFWRNKSIFIGDMREISKKHTKNGI